MIEIFLSYSGTDKNNIDTIVNSLHLTPSRYSIWYYKPGTNITMNEALQKLHNTDLFFLFLSNNSLNSYNVQKELELAIKLTQIGQIKGLYPILIDTSIDITIDKRIPQYIKNHICFAASPLKAAKIIEEIIKKY